MGYLYKRDDWSELQVEAKEWGDQVFGNNEKRTDPLPSIKHLEKEVQELLAEPYDLVEYADCMMLIITGAMIAGYTMDDLLKACKDKFEVNRQRKWSKPDADGVCYHVKE